MAQGFPFRWPEAREGLPILARNTVSTARRFPDSWFGNEPLLTQVRYDSSKRAYHLRQADWGISRIHAEKYGKKCQTC